MLVGCPSFLSQTDSVKHGDKKDIEDKNTKTEVYTCRTQFLTSPEENNDLDHFNMYSLKTCSVEEPGTLELSALLYVQSIFVISWKTEFQTTLQKRWIINNWIITNTRHCQNEGTCQFTRHLCSSKPSYLFQSTFSSSVHLGVVWWMPSSAHTCVLFASSLEISSPHTDSSFQCSIREPMSIVPAKNGLFEWSN